MVKIGLLGSYNESPERNTEERNKHNTGRGQTY